MKTAKRFAAAAVAVIGMFAITGGATPDSAMAHCDTLDGPVAVEAMNALDAGDVTPVLKWVNKEDENEIEAVFNKALAVRSNGPVAREIADRYFLETLIRLHRAGEGAPFTGLKPAGTIEPAVAAADKAMEVGSVDALAEKIGRAAEEAVRQRFARLMSAKSHKDGSVAAGREYVDAYVVYVHFVEELHNMLIRGGSHGSHAEAKEDANHGH